MKQNHLADNYELRIKNVETYQIKYIYEGVPDPLGLLPHEQEIEQQAVSDDIITSEINHAE